MKFDAHVYDVGFIPYLVAQVIPEPQKADRSFVPRFLYAVTRHCKPAAGTRLKSYNIHETNYCFDAIPMLRSIVRR